MARDYKHQVRRKPRRKPAPPWVWMLAGLGIGLFVALLIYLKAGPDDAPVARVVEAPPVEREARGVKKDPPAPIPPPPRPRFDFYTTLPEMEVVVPEDEITGSRKEGVRQVDKPGTYLLQAGSFRTHEQADRLKAQLALLGLETGIQTVSINDRETWHRVRVGPFRDLDELHKIRVQLKSHKVDAILIRVRE